MGTKLQKAAATLLCGFIIVGAFTAVDGIILNSGAIAAQGGNGEGGGGNGGPGGGGGNNGNDKDVGNGAAAAAAGALNAANASPNARANAAANSRVGRIAAFEALAPGLLAAREAAQAELNALQTEQAILADAKEVLDDPLASVAEISAAEAAIGGYTTLANLDTRLAELPGLIANSMTEVAEAQQNLVDALEPAANKEVTPGVVESVLGWLGISN